MAGAQFVTIRRTPNPPIPKPGSRIGIDYDAIIAAQQKVWDDLTKNDPIVAQRTAAIAAHQGPHGTLTATTAPTTALVPNPALHVPPIQVTNDFLNNGPSQAQKDAARKTPAGSSVENVPGFWARGWKTVDEGMAPFSAVGHFFHHLKEGIYNALGSVADNKDPSFGSGFSSLGHGFAAGFSGAAPEQTLAEQLNIHMPTNDIAAQMLQAANDQTNSSTFGKLTSLTPAGTSIQDAAQRAKVASINFTGDTLTDPWTWVPTGLATRAGKLGLQGVGKVVDTVRGVKDAEEAANVVGPHVIPHGSGPSPAGPVPGSPIPATPPVRTPDVIQAELDNAVKARYAAEQKAAATGGKKGIVDAKTGKANATELAGHNDKVTALAHELTAAKTTAAEKAATEAKVAQAAQEVHTASISDQLAEVKPPADVHVHVDQSVHNVPKPAVAKPEEANVNNATSELQHAVADNQPVSEGLISTLAEKPPVTTTVIPPAGRLVRHPKLGAVDAPTLAAHIAKQENALKGLQQDIVDLTNSKQAIAPNDATKLDQTIRIDEKIKRKVAQGRAIQNDVAKSKKLHASIPETPSHSTERAAVPGANASSQVHPDTVNPPAEPVQPPDPLPGTNTQPQAAGAVGTVSEAPVIAAPTKPAPRTRAAKPKVARTKEQIKTEGLAAKAKLAEASAKLDKALAGKDKILIEKAENAFDATEAKYKKLVAEFKAFKEPTISEQLAETAPATATPVESTVEAEIAPIVEPRNQTIAEVGDGAQKKIDDGTAPMPPSDEVRKEAVKSTKAKITDEESMIKLGRPKLPSARNPVTGSYPRRGEPKGLLYVNTFDQAKASTMIMRHAIKQIPNDLVGAERVAAVDAIKIPMTEKYMNDAIAAGHFGHISSDPAHYSKMETNAYALWYHDVHSVAAKYDENPHFDVAESYQAAKKTAIPQGPQMVGAAKALDLEHETMSHAQKVDEIVKAMLAYTKESGFTPNPDIYASFAEAMIKGTPDLKEIMMANVAGYKVRLTEDAKNLMHNANDNLKAAIVEPSAARSDAIHAMANMGGNLSKAGDEIGAAEQSIAAAAAGHGQFAAQAGIGETEVASARAELANNRLITSQSLKPDGSFSQGVKTRIADRNMAVGNKVDDTVDSTVMPTLSPPDRAAYPDAINLAHRAEYRNKGRLGLVSGRWLEGTKTGLLRGDPRSGVIVGRDVLREVTDSAEAIQNIVAGGIRKVRGITGYTDENAVVAMNAIKNHTTPDFAVNPVAHAIHKEMKDIQQLMLETNAHGDQTLATLFNQGHSIEDMNKELDWMGLKEFHFDVSKVDKTLPLDQQYQQLYGQWREWDWGTDPLDKMEMLHSVMIHSKARKVYAETMASNFGSPVAKPGWHPVYNDRNKDWATRYIPPGTYFPKDIIHQMGALEYGMYAGKMFDSSKALGKWLNGTYIPFENLAKQLLTTAQPSFIQKNMIGDWWAAAMADNVYNPVHYTHAGDIMDSVGQLKSSGINIQEQLGKAADPATVHGDKSWMTIQLKGGKTAPTSINDAARKNFQLGLIQSFHPADDVARDMITGETVKKFGLIGNVSRKISNTSPMRFTSEAASKSSTYMRLAHMDKLMRDSKFTRKFATEDEAWKAAAARVRWVHPDPGSLTHFESKYLRHLIPFYTWQRSIIMPTVLSAVNNPRNLVIFTNLTEALNTMAQSNEGNVGNPYDQWDTGTQRPNYVTSNIFGAYGNMGGIARKLIGPGFTGGPDTPGSQSIVASMSSPLEQFVGPSGLLTGTNNQNPDSNTLKDVLGGAVRKVAGQTSPLVKVPMAVFGKQFTDQGVVDIKDTGKFIDSLLPFANQISQVSNRSVSDIMGGLIQGRVNLEQANPDKKSAITTALLNMLTPGKLTDVNTSTLHRAALNQQVKGLNGSR